MPACDDDEDIDDDDDDDDDDDNDDDEDHSSHRIDCKLSAVCDRQLHSCHHRWGEGENVIMIINMSIM